MFLAAVDLFAWPAILRLMRLFCHCNHTHRVANATRHVPCVTVDREEMTAPVALVALAVRGRAVDPIPGWRRVDLRARAQGGSLIG